MEVRFPVFRKHALATWAVNIVDFDEKASFYGRVIFAKKEHTKCSHHHKSKEDAISCALSLLESCTPIPKFSCNTCAACGIEPTHSTWYNNQYCYSCIINEREEIRKMENLNDQRKTSI